MSCFYVAVDFFTKENAKKAFEFCKGNFEWFVEGDGDSAGFELSGTKITDAVDSNGEGLDSDEFDALSEANWLKELSENGFDFKAQIVSDDSYSGENDILECESKCKEFNSKRCSFMYDNGWGFDIIENPHDGFKPCNDIWSQEPVEMTLIFKCKKTGKKYKYVSECSIGADTFDEIMDDDYNLECGCFTLTPDGSDSWTLEEIDFDNLHYSKEFVPIDGGEILDDDVDEYDFDEELIQMYAQYNSRIGVTIGSPTLEEFIKCFSISFKENFFKPYFDIFYMDDGCPDRRLDLLVKKKKE